MIEVTGLTKLYGEVAAVKDLSFSVAAGEVVGMVGPNGAGKTTTLRSIVGIIRPTAGSIRIAGHDLAAEPVAAKHALAFIPDEPHLFDYLTVEEHLRFVARLYGVADPGPRIDELLQDAELSERRTSFPDELSRGMKQKLAIACGLLHDPRALLLDEPLTGLDPGSIRRTKQTIRRQAESGAAMVLSSHLSAWPRSQQAILVINRGSLIASGSTRDRGTPAGARRLRTFMALTQP
jgi:ABC-2 type transport system ATP-binding protein